MNGIVGVTGTPGTGKKTVAPIIAESLGMKSLALNELAKSHGLSDGDEVDTRGLRAKLEGGLPMNAVVYGHLLPYVLGPNVPAAVVVLRCEPAVLKERLRSRGYEASKVVENIEAELIGVLSADSFEAYGRARTFEVDTTRTLPGEAAGSIRRLLLSRPSHVPRIDWTLDYDSGAKLKSLLSVEG